MMNPRSNNQNEHLKPYKLEIDFFFLNIVEGLIDSI